MDQLLDGRECMICSKGACGGNRHQQDLASRRDHPHRRSPGRNVPWL